MTITFNIKGMLDKACLDLSRHPATRAFAPFFMDGEMMMRNDVPTAATDGFREFYNAQFWMSLPPKQRVFLVLHEKGHKFLMHMIRLSPRMKRHMKIFNIAADYAVNALIIEDILPQAADIMERIPTCLYDAKYSGWSMEDIFEDLMKEMQDSGRSEPDFSNSKGSPLDDHSTGTVDEMTPNEIAEAARDITESVRQGQMMAGKGSANQNLSVENALAPRVDWRSEMQEFFTENSAGRDDLTFRRFNRRALVDDRYMPVMESEVMDEMVVAFDVSGSMVDMIPVYAAAVQDAALAAKPNKIRVLWWDSQVTSEQVFTDYEDLAGKMRPVGGGGTRVTSVSDYIVEKGIAPTSLLMFTDGEVESDINWRVTCPSLWFVHGHLRNRFNPPAGRLVKVTE